jgi:hypothetical protein
MAISRPLQPQTLGCVCVSLFEKNGDLLVASAKRSSEVLYASGLKSTLPTFGVEANTIGGERSRYSLLFYNYLREFAEEFFDLEELIDTINARRIHPDWILKLPAVETITHEVKKRRLITEYLGVAINPADGALVCAVLAWFQSGQFFTDLTKRPASELGIIT